MLRHPLEPASRSKLASESGGNSPDEPTAGRVTKWLRARPTVARMVNRSTHAFSEKASPSAIGTNEMTAAMPGSAAAMLRAWPPPRDIPRRQCARG
jgi:hypothetical protein